jgi:peptidoglycan/LPS O-acetylase OafA/YrhL
MFLLASIYPSLYYYRAPYLNLDSHIGTFLAGSAFGIYFYYAKRSNFTKSQRVFWEVVSFTLAIVIASQASKHIFFKYLQIPFSGDYPYISGFVGILFIKELIHPGIISNCMDWPVFTFSGKISFSVYLLHPIGLHFAKDLKGQDQFLWSAIYTLILGLFGYYVIEAPLEKVSRRICKSLDKILKNKLNLETARIFQV